MLLPHEVSGFHGIVYSSCEHLYDVLPALILKFKNKCRWLAVYHWVEDYPWIDKRGGTPILHRYLYWFNRYLSGLLIKYFSDEILAVSDVTKEKLIKIKRIPSDKIRAVYCGVDIRKIQRILDKNNKKKSPILQSFDAVYMKRLDYGKGVFDLLTIWKNVCQKKKKAKLLIIGEGSSVVVQKIAQYVQKHNLENNIKLAGPIYDETMKFRMLASAKLFVLPSHEENWAIVIGEALACKIPVLAYKIKEIIPIWQKSVTWVTLGSIEEFSNKILHMLDSKKDNISLIEKGFTYVKRYDWDTIAKNEVGNI
jgi:glycosyltransferase involved in cell wall biosynthesis